MTGQVTRQPVAEGGARTPVGTVNKHVDFTGHAATLKLAETEVGEGHWSRRNGG